MNTKCSISAISAAIVIALTSGCGGGGGGGSDSGNNEEAPRQQTTLTELPTFIQGKAAECEFIENGIQTSLENYSGNLDDVSALHCDNAALADLNGIEQLTALVSLTLTNSGITAINELLNNTTITQLNLSGNTLTDLSSLASLINLTDLNLSNTGLTDTTALSGLTALQQLDLSGNDIESIIELANLVELTLLDLAGNNIEDVMPLNGLTQLVELQLTGNNNLDCSNVFALQGQLPNNAIESVPSACDNALSLSATSPEASSVDNSQLAEPYGRVVIVGDFTLDNVNLDKNGDNLSLRLMTDSGNKTITFTNWYVSSDHEVSVFELPSGAEYSFNSLSNLIGVAQELTEFDDEFNGSPDKDILYGLAGNDIIFGEHGADTLVGGKDDDTLIGSSATFDNSGNVISLISDSSVDTYVYHMGDGNDSIYEFNSSQMDSGLLILGPDVLESMITLQRDGSELVFYLDESNSITLYNWFASGSHRIGNIQFHESDTVNASDWVSQTGYTTISDIVEGTSNGELLLGSDVGDTIIGNGGADTIEGKQGDDKLVGGSASIDSNGNITNTFSDGFIDTYLYSVGDGNDTIYEFESNSLHRGILSFGPDITIGNFNLQRNGDDLVFFFNELNSITIYNWYQSINFRLGSIQFGENEPMDATEWVNSQPIVLLQAGTLEGSNESNILVGSISNDIIVGNSGADTIEGKQGDDKLIGGSAVIDANGNITNTFSDGFVDTYLYSMGDGNDTIYDFNSNSLHRSILSFGPGITQTDITVSQSDNDLVFTISSGGSITVYNWFTSSTFQIGTIQFDGQPALNASDFVESKL